jgi:hypothetical protein
MILFAILRPPRPAPKPARSSRPAMNLEKLGALLLLADDSARVIGRTPDSLEIAVDTGTGQNLGVTVRAREIRIKAEPDDKSPRVDEEHGGVIEVDETDIEEAAGDLVCKLQGATGWHVESDHLLGFDPDGVCPSCQIECFEWQDRCSACDAELERVDTVEIGEEALAKRFLAALLREELIELTTRRGVQSVESSLAGYLANGWTAPARLLELLVELKEVAEVFASEDDIERLLDAAESGRGRRRAKQA